MLRLELLHLHLILFFLYLLVLRLLQRPLLIVLRFLYPSLSPSYEIFKLFIFHCHFLEFSGSGCKLAGGLEGVDEFVNRLSVIHHLTFNILKFGSTGSVKSIQFSPSAVCLIGLLISSLSRLQVSEALSVERILVFL